MSRQAALKNVFKIDGEAKVVPMEVAGQSLSDVSFAGLLVNPDYQKVEGRGTYEELRGESSGRHRYVKGSGNTESLKSELTAIKRSGTRLSDTEYERQFPQFGHRNLNEIFFGGPPSLVGLRLTGPKVRGALALPFAIAEVLNAEMFLRLMMIKEKIGSRAEAQARGLTIPEGVVSMPTISAEISEAIARAKELVSGKPQPKNQAYQFKYGLAALTVPSAQRLRTREDVKTSRGLFWRRMFASEEKMQMVGRVLKHQLECGFVSLSTHLQNVYNAPLSLCPQADNSDLVPISEILRRGVPKREPEKPYLCALVMRQLGYLPFNQTLYVSEPDLQLLARIAVQTALSTVAPGLWSQTEYDRLVANYQRKPFSVLSGIAERLIDEGVVRHTPDKEWTTLRRKYQEYGYGMIADSHIHRALHDAISTYSKLDSAERKCGLRLEDLHIYRG